MPMSCLLCDYVARDRYNLKRHHATKHIFTRFKCRWCKILLSSESEARAHENNCSQEFSCFHCGIRSANKDRLREHIKRSHIRLTGQKRSNLLQCSLCSFRSSGRESMEIHLCRDHHKSLDKKLFSFDDEDMFYEWKTELESSDVCAYTNKKTVIKNGYKYTYFYCFRSGMNKTIPMESRKKPMKSLGPNKINGYCPARISMRVKENGKVEVSYIATHVGHNFELGRLRLPKKFRESLAMKMKMHIPFDEIIRTEQEKAKGCSEQELQRSVLLQRHDLYNIARAFKVRNDVTLPKKDAVTDQALISRNDESERLEDSRKTLRTSNPSIVFVSPNDDSVFTENSNSQDNIITVDSVFSENSNSHDNIITVDSVFSENSNSLDNIITVDSVLNEIVSQPKSYAHDIEEAISKFAEVARTVQNDEQLAAVNDSISSLGATLAALQQTHNQQLENLPTIVFASELGSYWLR